MDTDQQQPKFTWVERNLELSAVRRMVNELLHFERPSGSFKIVNRQDDDRRYDFYFDDYSCSLLQEAWEGWDPSEQIGCDHVTFGADNHCGRSTCTNFYGRHVLASWQGKESQDG